MSKIEDRDNEIISSISSVVLVMASAGQINLFFVLMNQLGDNPSPWKILGASIAIITMVVTVVITILVIGERIKKSHKKTEE